MNQIEQLVRHINTRPGHPKAVLAITGGGAEAIGYLLKYGGGSSTLLEAVVPYDQQAFNDFVRGKPDKYCSAGAARDLAMAAYIRANKLTYGGVPSGTVSNVIGVGASCSLKKDGSERAGRKHFAYIAFQTRDLTASYEYELLHDERTTREQEESFAAERIIHALLAGMISSNDHLWADNSDVKYELKSNIIGHDAGRQLIHGEKHIHTITINPPDVMATHILPGSFNPVHERHLEIAEAVHKMTGERVDFELCIRNVDKPPINYFDMNFRQDALTAALTDKPYAGNLHFTTAPTFAEKAELFPGCTFVVGMDTYLRIADLKYYGGDEERRFKAIDRLRELKCRFLVFNRIINGAATTQVDALQAPYYLNNLAKPIPDSILPPNDMSSTRIRKENLELGGK